jgi:threonine/homoserine efflux transporter RhtA
MPRDEVITAEDNQMRLPWWGVLCVIVGAALAYFVFDHFGEAAIARPTLYSVAIIIITIAMRWRLRGYVWFWATIAVFGTLHALLILLVPWADKWIPALVVIPIGVADSYAMLWIVSLVGKLMRVPMATGSKHPRSKKMRQDQEV